jgi:hypothetical protein
MTYQYPPPYQPYQPPPVPPRKSHALRAIGSPKQSHSGSAKPQHAIRTAAAKASAPGTLGDRITAWNHSPGGKDERTLGRLLGAMSRAAGAGNEPVTARACGKITAEVSQALAAPQIPDRVAAHWYAAALADYSTAGTDCQDGITSGDTALVTKGASLLDQGTRDLGKATARIRAIGRQAGR